MSLGGRGALSILDFWPGSCIYPDNCEGRRRRRKRSCKPWGSLRARLGRRPSEWLARCCTRPAGRAASGSTSSRPGHESRAGRDRREEGSSTSCRGRGRPQPLTKLKQIRILAPQHPSTIFLYVWFEKRKIDEASSNTLFYAIGLMLFLYSCLILPWSLIVN